MRDRGRKKDRERKREISELKSSIWMNSQWIFRGTWQERQWGWWVGKEFITEDTDMRGCSYLPSDNGSQMSALVRERQMYLVYSKLIVWNPKPSCAVIQASLPSRLLTNNATHLSTVDAYRKHSSRVLKYLHKFLFKPANFSVVQVPS